MTTPEPAVSPAPDTEALRQQVAQRLSDLDARDWGGDHGFVPSYGSDRESDAFVDAVVALVAEREATHAEVARTWEAYRLRSVEQKREWRRKVAAAEEENAGLRADLGRARAELADLRHNLALRAFTAPDADDETMLTSLDARITDALTRVPGARPIPDDAAVVARVKRLVNEALNLLPIPMLGTNEEMITALARIHEAMSGATPTTGPAPAAADGPQRFICATDRHVPGNVPCPNCQPYEEAEPPQAPPTPRPDLPECGATEGGMGVDCHLPAGHTCWHAAHHTPRTDGTESIGYPFDIQWPRNEWDRCPPAAPQAPAESTGEDFAATLDGLNEQARILRNLPAPQLAARRDAATPDVYNDDERFEFLRGPCSCQPVRTWIHVPGTYCGDTQHEQAVDAMRAKTGRPGDERDEEAVSAVLGYLANPTPEEKQ